MMKFLLRRLGGVSAGPYLDHCAELCRLRGMIVGQWAGIESCIDQANNAGWLHTKKSIAPRIPVNFKRKVDLFHKLHKDTSMMRPLAVEAEAILNQLTPLLDARHALVHGYFTPDERDRVGWRLTRHLFNKDGMTREERYFSRDDLGVLSDKLNDIQLQAADYVRAVTLRVNNHFHQSD